MADSQEKTVGGLKCKQTSFRRTLPFYKDIGGKLRIKERRSTIRDHDITIFLTNRYFLKDEFAMGASAQLVEFKPPVEGSRVFFKTWRHRHFATGIGIKLGLDGSVSPTTGIIGFMPLVGVMTETSVLVEKDGVVLGREEFFTSKGSVPDNITQRVYIPRIGVTPISTRANLIQAGFSIPVSVRAAFDEAGVFRQRPLKSLRTGLLLLR